MGSAFPGYESIRTYYMNTRAHDARHRIGRWHRAVFAATALEGELIAIRFLNARIEIEFEPDAAGFINHRVPLWSLTEILRREFGHHAWPFRNARKDLV